MEGNISTLRYEASGQDVLTFTADGINKTDNLTVNVGRCGNSLHDIELEKPIRLLVLYLTICLCIIGSILVVLWMVFNRRISPKFNHLSRVNAFILNLTLADILVIVLAVIPQLVWEYVDREWMAGDVLCRLVKFLQSFSMMSSNYMLVVIAIDRHQAIRSPLKESISIWKLAGSGWFLAALFSLPVMGVFHTNEVGNMTRCENIFRYVPHWHRQIWMTWVMFVVVFVPLVMLVVCYIRIFMKISHKASQNSVKFKSGKVSLQSTHSNSLPRAKIKTLKMTFVIILTFIICSVPYFIVEMIMTYGDYCVVSKKLYALLGGMAACNSATNPYVFLLFNVKLSWFKQLKECGMSTRNSPSRTYHSCHTGSSGANSHNTIILKNSEHHKNGRYFRQDTMESHVDMKLIHK